MANHPVYSTIPGHSEFIEIVNACKIDQNSTIQEFNQSIEFNALLWEVEDYLVRDWDVRLQLNYSDKTKEIIRVHLKNEKPQELNAGWKLDDKEKGKAGNKWQTRTTRLPITDTDELSPSHPYRLENRLGKMERNQYEAFKDFIEEKQQSIDPSEQVSLPDHDEHLDLVDLAKQKSQILARFLKDFENESIPRIQKIQEINKEQELAELSKILVSMDNNAFQKLGETYKGLLNMTPEDGKKKVIENVLKLKNPQERSNTIKFIIEQCNRAIIKQDHKYKASNLQELLTSIEELATRYGGYPQIQKVLLENQSEINPDYFAFLNMIVGNLGLMPPKTVLLILQQQQNIFKEINRVEVANLLGQLDQWLEQAESSAKDLSITPFLKFSPEKEEPEEKKQESKKRTIGWETEKSDFDAESSNRYAKRPKNIKYEEKLKNMLIEWGKQAWQINPTDQAGIFLYGKVEFYYGQITQAFKNSNNDEIQEQVQAILKEAEQYFTTWAEKEAMTTEKEAMTLV